VGASTPEDGDPVPDIEVGRASIDVEATLAGQALPRHRWHRPTEGASDRPRAVVERASNQRQVGEAFRSVEEFGPTSRDREHPGVDRRRRLEAVPWDASDESELPPGEPTERGEGAAVDRRPLPGGLELDQQVGSLELDGRIVEQPTQDRRGERERDVPEGAPTSCRERGSHYVAVHDLHVRPPLERASKPLDELGIELDGRYAAGVFGERPRETSGARADLQHVVGRTDVSTTDELGRDQTAAKEVLAVRPGTAAPRRARARAHGPSPRSCSSGSLSVGR